MVSSVYNSVNSPLNSAYFSLRYVEADTLPTRIADSADVKVAWDRLLGKTSTFVPTLWGITHRDEELSDHIELIREARREGAATVGLELTPARYSSSDNSTGHFELLAKAAEECGLEVFPLETDASQADRSLMAHVYKCLGDNGQFDDSIVSAALANIADIVSYERSTTNGDEKRALFYERVAETWKSVRSYLKSINNDISRFYLDWYRVHIVRANSEMMGAIERDQPDIVLVGNHHAQELAHLTSYRHVDATTGARISADEIDKFIPHTHAALRKAFDEMVYDTNKSFAITVIRGFEKLMINVYGKPSRHEDALAVLDAAATIQPKILKIFVRYFKTHPEMIGHLAPDRDLDILAIPSDTAQRLLRGTIQSAFYRTGLE